MTDLEAFLAMLERAHVEFRVLVSLGDTEVRPVGACRHSWEATFDGAGKLTDLTTDCY